MGILSKTITVMLLFLVSESTQSLIAQKATPKNTCLIEKSNQTILFEPPTDDRADHNIFIVSDDGAKELVHSGNQRAGWSIAINRSSRSLVGNAVIHSDEPNPFVTMQPMRAALNNDILVIVFKMKTPNNDASANSSNMAGGFFFDHIFASSQTFLLGFTSLPPHTNFSWGDPSNPFIIDYSTFRAPWHEEHNGYEYFLRSFIKDKEGKWKVHISAALSVLWADSMGLPIKSLSIENENTYAVTFDGKYKYYTIKADNALASIYQEMSEDLKKYTHSFIDVYGELEQLVYKGEILPGETVEKIKYIPPAEAEDLDENEEIFQRVYTTIRGGTEFRRIAYEKDYWRRPSSWVDVDELSLEQVFRTEPPILGGNDVLSFDRALKMGKYGALPIGHKPLDDNEVRMTYTMNVEEAIKRLNDQLALVSKAADKHPSLKFLQQRYQLYLKLIEEQLETE